RLVNLSRSNSARILIRLINGASVSDRRVRAKNIEPGRAQLPCASKHVGLGIVDARIAVSLERDEGGVSRDPAVLISPQRSLRLIGCSACHKANNDDEPTSHPPPPAISIRPPTRAPEVPYEKPRAWVSRDLHGVPH